MAKKLINLIVILLIASFSTPPAFAQAPDPPEHAQNELAPHVPGEVLVKFQPWVNSSQAAQHLTALNLKVKRLVPALGVKLVKLPPGQSVEDALEHISNRPGVEYVEPNYILEISALPQEEITDQWSLTKIQAPAAWATFSEAKKIPVVLAAVDTGIDPAHTDLAANIWSNGDEIAGNGLDDDANGYIDDTWGWDFVNNDSDPFDDNLHGTAVSSVMAGVLDQSGVAGVCPWCRVMAVKVMTDQGIGYLDVVANGITYAADNNAKVINLSLAGTAGALVLQDAVDYAWTEGALVVAGAGNDGANAPMYPAGYANAMAISATGESDTHACFSNYAQDYISVAAPGENMLVALPNNQYGVGSGTSLSSPLVVGLAGLLLSQDDTRTHSELRAIIENTAVDLSPPGLDAAFGHGRIDVLRAVSNDTSQVTPPDGMFSTNGTASGYAHARKLVRDTSGTLHVIWHTQEGNLYRIRYATSSDEGSSWDLQPDVYSSPQETYHSALAADGDNLYVAIPRRSAVGAPYQILFAWKPIDSGSWSQAIALTDGTYEAVRPDLYLDPTNGRLHMLASSLDNAPLLYYRSTTDPTGPVNSWGPITQINPSAGTASAGANTRYATLHANGDNLYIATKTMTQIWIFTTFYLHTVRSTDGGQTWFDQTQIASFQASTSGDYGLSLAGVGDRLYMVYELFTNIYFRRFDNGSWSNYEELELGSGDDLFRWPTITQAPGGQAWMMFEANSQLYMREYDGSVWAPKQAMGSASYANLKLGTSGEKVEWISTQCNGAPYLLDYDSIQLGANSAPTADDQSVTTDEDTALPIILTAIDPEKDPLTYSITGQPFNGSLSGTPPAVTYQPIANYHGEDRFTFVAHDGNSNSNQATVSITVDPVNDPPTANHASLTTGEDTPLGITLTGGDVDGDPITYSIDTNPQHGTLSGTPPNVVYTPDVDYTGLDSFSFTTNDGTLASTPGTITIQVNPANDPPTANDQSLITDEDVDLAVLLTASDAENDPLTYTITLQPSNGTLSSSLPSLTYQPGANYNGADSFSFVANDGNNDSNPGTISITVDSVNDAPVASNVSDSTQQDTTDTWFPVVSDVDGEALNCTITAGPGGGASASVELDCSSGQYSPPAGYSGTDSFTYQVCDGSAACDQAAVSYTITANSLHVGDLDGSSAPAPRSRWDATISITVHDAFENPVANALVDGSWSDRATGGSICTTDPAGECSVTKTNIKGNTTSATFTINTISHPALNYKPADNHDPELDSDGTSIIMYQDSQPLNQPPQASFTFSCSDLTCEYDATGSFDSDGNITSYAWDFGDGNFASGITPSHTYASAGTRLVVLTVTDDGTAMDSAPQSVTTGSPGIQEMHVGDLDGSDKPGRKGRWDAIVSIGIHVNELELVEGATVTGVWNTGREMSCTTSPTGYCSLTLANIKTSDPFVTFTVIDVAAPGWVYNSNLNHDIDVDNNGTTITISYQ